VNEWHLSDDPELTAGYVLERIPPAERERIDAHLQVCADCRAHLEAELRVAAAARRLGRDELKARLRRRLDRQTRARRILAVAATIVTLIGAGILTRQLTMHRDEAPTTQELTDRVTPSPPEERERLRASPQTGPAASDLRDKKGSHEGVADRASRADESTTLSTGAPPPRAAVLEKTKEAPFAPAQKAEVAGTVVGEETFWTEGIATAPVRTKERTLNAAAEKKDVDGAGAGIAPSGQQFVVTQRRFSELPESQLNRQALRNSVPTLVQQQGGRTLLTLYLDSLMDQNELTNARVEQHGADSLVIRMQNQSIQYQLPANRTRQQVR